MLRKCLVSPTQKEDLPLVEAEQPFVSEELCRGQRVLLFALDLMIELLHQQRRPFQISFIGQGPIRDVGRMHQSPQNQLRLGLPPFHPRRRLSGECACRFP